MLEVNAAREAGGNPSTARYEAAVEAFQTAIMFTLLVPHRNVN
jgi:hypothetical protein